MTQTQIKINFLNLLKLKIFLFHAPSFAFFSSFSDISIFEKSFKSIEFNGKISIRGEFSQNIKSMFSFLSDCKQKVFAYNFNLSRFTTVKYRIVDRRYRQARLTEFSFNLDSNVVKTAGLEKTKLSVSLFINAFNFEKHVLPVFLRTHGSLKLKPWQRTYSLLLRKFSVKQFELNSLIFSKNNLLLFNLFICHCLAIAQKNNLLQKFQVIGSRLRVSCYPGFINFKRKFQKLWAGGETGLIVFKNPRVSLLTLEEGKELNAARKWPVRHYGEYYPFSKKEIELSGANKLISDKQKGKATYFILETNRMLKRKTKTVILSLPKKANRIFPATPLYQVLTISASIKERFFVTSRYDKCSFNLFYKS
jgi:hypothetical protein